MSCLIVVVIAVFYEYVRAIYKQKVTRPNDDLTFDGSPQERQSLLANTLPAKPGTTHTLVQSLLYTLMAALSLWLMLIFMTYNGFIMIAVILGAGVGHYLFGKRPTGLQPFHAMPLATFITHYAFEQHDLPRLPCSLHGFLLRQPVFLYPNQHCRLFSRHPSHRVLLSPPVLYHSPPPILPPPQ